MYMGHFNPAIRYVKTASVLILYDTDHISSSPNAFPLHLHYPCPITHSLSVIVVTTWCQCLMPLSHMFCVQLH